MTANFKVSRIRFAAGRSFLKAFAAGLFLLLLFIQPSRVFALGQESSDRSTPATESSEKTHEQVDESDAYRHSSMVKAIGSKFGLDAEQAASVFTILNLVILVGAIGWLLGKSLPKTFRNRNTTIQKQLVDARSATEEAGARLSNVEGRLGKLDEQIASLRSQGEKDLAEEEGRIKASIESEKARILQAAEQEIASVTAQAQREIKRFAADLAIDQAAKKLVVSAETDRLLVQEFARKLSGSRGKTGGN